jgi:hypothetical protein
VRTVCLGLRVLRIKYLAAPTRRTTVTTVGAGLPNHCLHQAYWFYFLNSFISSFTVLCACSYLFEDFDVDARIMKREDFCFCSFIFSFLSHRKHHTVKGG